jgi:Uma2 family endonuclease
MSLAVAPPKRRTRQTGAKRLTCAPLENGDRLTSAEFLRRYEVMPEVRKAELIDGLVFLHMLPLSADAHAEPDNLIQTWLGTFAAHTPGVKAYTNPTLVLDRDNTPQPDAVLCSAPRPGGRVWLNEKGYLCGAPEFVCEIAASTASSDLHAKFSAYRRRGVAEYLVWVVRERRVRWFILEEEEYVEQKERAGMLSSRVFPRLVLNVRALLRGDGAKVLATLREQLGH